MNPATCAWSEGRTQMVEVLGPAKCQRGRREWSPQSSVGRSAIAYAQDVISADPREVLLVIAARSRSRISRK
jgi:hypothetical protein